MTIGTRIARTALALAIAAAGGGVFTLLSLPAPWLTGGMIAVAIAAMARVPLDYPPKFTNFVFVVLGSSLGTGVSPDLVGQLGRWPVSLALIAVAAVATQMSCDLFLHRVCGWDRNTSFFAAIPGMASYVIALALPTGADITRIALSQTLRVFLLVGLTPSVIIALEGSVSMSRAVAGPTDLALTLLAGTVGSFVFHYLKAPAPPVLGAMTGSGILHATGLATGAFPPLLLAVLFTAMGALIGTRFVGTTLAMLRSAMPGSVGAFFVAVTISAAVAWLATLATGRPFGELALAFAPGGLDVMTAMAFALNLDPAFVAGHQLARFLVIVVYAPLLARRLPAVNQRSARE